MNLCWESTLLDGDNVIDLMLDGHDVIDPTQKNNR